MTAEKGEFGSISHMQAKPVAIYISNENVWPIDTIDWRWIDSEPFGIETNRPMDDQWTSKRLANGLIIATHHPVSSNQCWKINSQLSMVCLRRHRKRVRKLKETTEKKQHIKDRKNVVRHRLLVFVLGRESCVAHSKNSIFLLKNFDSILIDSINRRDPWNEMAEITSKIAVMPGEMGKEMLRKTYTRKMCCFIENEASGRKHVFVSFKHILKCAAKRIFLG